MKTTKKIFAANWKLHKTPAETRSFFREFLQVSLPGEIWFFPPASSWEACAESLRGSNLQWGGQNVWSQVQGAFTGENSAAVLKELRARGALVGHSERRRLFGEGDELLADKVAVLQGLDLTPVFCFGETLEERDAGRTDEVNRRQLQKGLGKAVIGKPLIVAYEPVWAIGTGRVATPEQVAAAHAAAHDVLKELRLADAPILYGGSVKPDNAPGLLGLPHVDGFLVGGASLEVASFQAICRAGQ
ncbi:MAG: triose-phosphate isomerase [Bdellovibrionaceae bacterium]|nr:triose-phosphate isomerase [Pseudobdellovibrionaceae bacterium]MBX3033091.1 triose-phosphate isomerase [Pseudobdellovibrionaceae bacterium]